jgi:hypothetical protein
MSSQNIDFEKEGLSWLDVQLVRNELAHIVQAADPSTYPDRSGLRYYLDVELPEFPQSTTFERLIRLEGREKPATISGGAEVYEGCSFRIDRLLAGQLSLAKPTRGQNFLSVIATLSTAYRLREIIEPAIRDQYLATRTALRAGLALRDFAGFGNNFFSRHQAGQKQFLTWQPDHKLVSFVQEEYLYFLLNCSPLPAQARLRVRSHKADGSRLVSTVASIQGVSLHQVVCCPAGPTALGLDPDTVQYEVWLSDESDFRFSEVRTYYIDARRHRYERFLLFSNSLGGFDTLRLLGKASEESDVALVKAQKERPDGAGIDFSELQVISVSETSGIEVSTGFFEHNAQEYLNYLRELLLSECIFLDTPHGHESVSLLTSNLAYRQDDPGLVERTFAFSRTYSDPNFSKLAPTDPIPDRPTAWRGVGNTHILDSFGKRTGYVKAPALRKYYTDTAKDFIPFTQKPNVEGDPDYIPPTPDPSVTPGSTPYPSALISREGTFRKSNCGPGEDGLSALISVPAGKYGGENAGDADLLAEADWKSLDTQAYADVYGTCAVAQNYSWTVPAGHFHVRTNMPAKVGVYHLPATGPADKGNIQALQGQSGTYVFPVGTNDLDFPVETGWYYHVFGTAGQTIRTEVYRNGILRQTADRTFASAGTANSYLFDLAGTGSALDLYSPASGDKFLIKLTIL